MNKNIKKVLVTFRNCFIVIGFLYTLKIFIFYHIPFYYYNILSNNSFNKEEVHKILYLFSSKKCFMYADDNHTKECMNYVLLGVPSMQIIYYKNKVIHINPEFDNVTL